MWHHIVENHLLQRRNALLEEQPGKWLALKTRQHKTRHELLSGSCKR